MAGHQKAPFPQDVHRRRVSRAPHGDNVGRFARRPAVFGPVAAVSHAFPALGASWRHLITWRATWAHHRHQLGADAAARCHAWMLRARRFRVHGLTYCFGFLYSTSHQPRFPGAITIKEHPVSKAKTQSAVIYRGPSLIDGAPIVVVAIIQSNNGKTGNMVQTYIIREDIEPLEASKTGADVSICGQCIHRGTPTDDPNKKQAAGRTCYVLLGQGPTIVYRALKRGYYPRACSARGRRAIGAGRMVRLGTYGDPAAVPSHVWRQLLEQAAGHTAYSHQAGLDGADFAPDLFMQSADSMEQARDAWAAGHRTFRVIPVRDWNQYRRASLDKNEILCPASSEGGFKTTCDKCGLCAGASKQAKSIAIVAHGTSARAFVGA